MTNRTQTGFLLLVLATGLAGCNGAGSSPTTPSTAPPTARPNGLEYVIDVTLSGVVYEMTPTGRVPIEGVQVYSSEQQAVGNTGTSGSFSFKPVWVCPCTWAPSVEAGFTSVYWEKEGYEDPAGQPDSIFYPGRTMGAGWRDVKIGGDTQFDIELVRR